MLRRAENVTVTHHPSWWTGKGWVVLTIGRTAHPVVKLDKLAFERAQVDQEAYPVPVASVGERRYWQFEGRCYWDNDGLDAAQVHALLVTKRQREAQRIERAQAVVAMGSAPRQNNARTAIPDDVKHLVWARDQGTCVHCGSTTELQFDHVIPVAMGGGTHQDNVQVLCGPCNRSKSAGLAVRR